MKVCISKPHYLYSIPILLSNNYIFGIIWQVCAFLSGNLHNFIGVCRFFSIPGSWSSSLRNHRPYDELFDWRYACPKLFYLMSTDVCHASLGISCIGCWDFKYRRMGSQALLASTQRRLPRPRSDLDLHPPRRTPSLKQSSLSFWARFFLRPRRQTPPWCHTNVRAPCQQQRNSSLSRLQ